MKNITPAKAAVNYGVIFGLLMIVEFIISYALAIDPQENKWVGIVNGLLNSLVFPFIFILLACNYFKKSTGGYITFGQSLKTGVATAVIAAAVFAVFNIIFNLIFPEFQQEILEKSQSMMVQQNPNMTAEQLKMGIKMAELFSKPYIAFPFTVLWYAFIGLIISLIVGALVKKENPGAF
jgi:hypothetical protein